MDMNQSKLCLTKTQKKKRVRLLFFELVISYLYFSMPKKLECFKKLIILKFEIEFGHTIPYLKTRKKKIINLF